MSDKPTSVAITRKADPFAQERAELEALLASGILARAPGLVRLLNHICERYFSGQTDPVKEYNVAVEALSRSSDFDPKEDSIVRVEAHRLRKKLAEYYSGPARNHTLQIRLLPGTYVPQFVRLAPSLAHVALAEMAPAAQYGVRIMAGSSLVRYVGQNGCVWNGDHNFTGGEVFFNPAQHVFRTSDPSIFQSRREGDFSYAIPLQPGTHELRLHFAETVFGPGNIGSGGESSRQFNVDVNGRRFLEQFDIVSDAGGSNVADVKVLAGVTPDKDGLLHIRFSYVRDKPMLNAIEILPSLPGEFRPLRMVAGQSCCTDRRGQTWEPDQYWMGGRTMVRPPGVTGTTDPELYHGERFGNFTYAIPVPAGGRYTLTLRFAETWFGPYAPAGGGAGSRLFDVHCNGVALLRNFDIFSEAGGAYQAVEKTLPRIAPNAQGKLNLAFVPVRNYACVNAIEVTGTV